MTFSRSVELAKLFFEVKDLLRVQLKDNVQVFDTMRNEVLFSTTKVPDTDTMDILYNNQLHFSQELKPFVFSYVRHTVQEKEAVSCPRLK